MPSPVDWRQIRAVVFDVDGTLYAQGRMRMRMLRQLALRCLERPATVADVRVLSIFRKVREELADREARGIGRLQYERAASRAGVPPARVEAVVREWILERPLPHLVGCRRPGTRRLFAALSESGRAIGVWSDYPVAGKLEALGLRADAMVAATDPEVDRLKPRPEGLERLLELLEVSAAETLLVGDRDERDGEAARRLGCPYLLVKSRPAGEREIADFEELLGSLAAAPSGPPAQQG